ncbi:MAG: heavy metal translocating P-type ATPase [Parcubacteria group bacterium]|nr:heavy metal translocating P-type ATPase [Candidatus Liptonbacteria bacterium]MBI3075348.1 heavy metal translocating P-type ATPase [Parcubacteria group bacterium]
MHPEIQKDKPGMCPECGMALVETRDPEPEQARYGAGKGQGTRKNGVREEYNKHGGHSTNMFLKRFWVSLILSVPIILYSEFPQTIFGFVPPAFPGSAYLTLALGSVVFFYGGLIFLQSAWRELRARLPGMMTLIALAITTAYAYSVFAVLGRTGMPLFWELATLVTVMLLGHWIEMRAVSGAQGALKELSKLIPDTAEVLRDGARHTITVGELREGDVVFVRPGARVPADGIVISGDSEANEAAITGESAPVSKKEGSEVIAGTTNGNGSLEVRVLKIGEHTFLAGIMRLVEEAQASKSRLQILSDKAAYFLTLIAVGSGGLTFTLWLLPAAGGAGVGFALERLVAVLVIACPHALGLAVPLVASIGTTMAARNGFLVRKRIALELARKINVVLFDKTGTLTKGEYGVTGIMPVTQFPISNFQFPNKSQILNQKNGNENIILQLAASVDSHSEHFISRAIVKEAEARGLPLLPMENFKRVPGKGVEGVIKEARISVGGAAMLEQVGASVPESIRSEIEEEGKKGKTIIYAMRGKELLGVLALSDIIREESRTAIKDLRALGVKVAMMTGDSENVAKWVAEELGIDDYFAKVLPQEKSEKVKLLQADGAKVAMVGDGINDAPALTQADVGIAIGAGTNVAIESAGIILVKNDPRDIVRIIKLSRLTFTKMLQNLFWATGYNVVAIPLAAGALAFQGLFLSPALAAVFMSLSTVIVAVNAVLLRRAQL